MSTRYEDTKRRKEREELRKAFLSRWRGDRIPPRLWAVIDKEALWQRLEEEGLVEEAFSSTADTDDELIGLAEEYLGLEDQAFSSDGAQRPIIGEGGEDSPGHEGTNADDFVAGEASKRAGAFTWYLLKVAAEYPMVRRFRQEVLGGGTASLAEAIALIDSPAAAVFSRDWFEEKGVPFLGHEAHVIEGEWPLSPESPESRGAMKVKWDGGELSTPFEVVAPFRSLEVFLMGEKRGKFWSEPPLTVLEDSVLGDLFGLAEHLTERFPWWEDARYMPMFVLMGRGPVVGLPYYDHYKPGAGRHGLDEHYRPYPLPPQSRLYTPITLKVAPWYAAESLKDIYLSIKERIPTTQMTSERRLALFEFVMKQPEVRVKGEGQVPEVPSWVELLRSWNDSLPAGHRWRYKHRGNFRRDFLKAFEQIVDYYR